MHGSDRPEGGAELDSAASPGEQGASDSPAEPPSVADAIASSDVEAHSRSASEKYGDLR